MRYFLLLLFALAVVAEPLKPGNTLISIDTVYVEGTDTAFTKAFPIDYGFEKAVVICIDDTSSGGFADDSADVDISLHQAFVTATYNAKYMRLFPSLAHPDSTGFPGGANFTYDANFTIADTDTLNKRLRGTDVRTDAFGDTVEYVPNMEVGAVYSTEEACAYYPLVPDASGAVAFRVIGNAGNKKGSSVKVLFELHQVGKYSRD